MKAPKRRNIDMTGFGGEREQTNSMNDKKANEAIRTNFLANLSFEGHKEIVRVDKEDKYGPTYYRSTSGVVSKERTSTCYIECHDHLSTTYHAKLGNTKASGSDLEYVADEVITESPFFKDGSRLEKRYPFRDSIYLNEKSVYYTSENERLDERDMHYDYIVYAPGAYFKKRTFWEKL
jgi:hypothetical protein